MRSMTGYGRCILDEDDRQITVELKSVNHRYLDLNIRIPRILSFLEDMLRSEIGARVSRSHIDIYINYVNSRVDAKSVTIDKNLFQAYKNTFLELQNAHGDVGPDVSISFILSQSEVVQLSPNPEDEASLIELAQKAVRGALDVMLGMREKEGERLHADMAQKIDSLKTIVNNITQRAEIQSVLYREKLTQRMAQLLNEAPLDETRIAMEAAMFADKSGIDEELVRLGSHFEQFLGLMEQSESVGRRLDFLMQEINREFNTIGSKSMDLDITNNVLDAKNIAEKLREQVQNIE